MRRVAIAMSMLPLVVAAITHARAESTVSSLASSSLLASSSPLTSSSSLASSSPLASSSSLASSSPLTSSSPDDARDLSALAACSNAAPYVAQWNAEQPVTWHCGQLASFAAPDVARLVASVPPLDALTSQRIRAIFADGAAKGRRANVFGIVGDSVSLESQFLTPLGAAPSSSIVLDPAARDALLLDDGTTILDFFRGIRAYGPLDSFRAPRAAKTGARVTWPLERDASTGESPLETMVRTLSPAYAIVLFGTNDALLLIEPLDRLATRFATGLRALVVALESRGIVPILTTVPRHMRAPTLPDCSARDGDRSNARLLVQTNIVTDVVTALAIDRHLPLIDLRAALDPLLNHGIASDGIHPTFYPRRLGGGAILDRHGLACGYNARTFVTLRALAQVRNVITDVPK